MDLDTTVDDADADGTKGKKDSRGKDQDEGEDEDEDEEEEEEEEEEDKSAEAWVTMLKEMEYNEMPVRAPSTVRPQCGESRLTDETRHAVSGAGEAPHARLTRVQLFGSVCTPSPLQVLLFRGRVCDGVCDCDCNCARDCDGDCDCGLGR